MQSAFELMRSTQATTVAHARADERAKAALAVQAGLEAKGKGGYKGQGPDGEGVQSSVQTFSLATGSTDSSAGSSLAEEVLASTVEQPAPPRSEERRPVTTCATYRLRVICRACNRSPEPIAGCGGE